MLLQAEYFLAEKSNSEGSLDSNTTTEFANNSQMSIDRLQCYKNQELSNNLNLIIYKQLI